MYVALEASLNVYPWDSFFQVSVADLPGLIEGASVNRGLGHSFLKHTQKARALALVVSYCIVFSSC